MLIDILRMPPVFGLPIDRRQTITSGDDHARSDVHTTVIHGVPIQHNRLTVGSAIFNPPSQLYKAIYVSDDSAHIFEVVFSVEADVTVCLYVKIINNQGSRFGIAVNAIKYFRSCDRHVFPLSHFLISNRLPGITSAITEPLIRTHALENVIPPVFQLNTLFTLFAEAMEKGPSRVDEELAMAYYPINIHLPQAMEALITGQFVRSPLMDLVERHPFIQPVHDKWFSWERLFHAGKARGLEINLNVEEYDNPALHLMSMGPTKFMSTMLISSAINGLNEIREPSFHEDPYSLITRVPFSQQRSWLAKILYDCVMIYCQRYQIDYNVFLNSPGDRSTITVGRNSYDEVEIIFQDNISNRFICFYSSFPALALTTLSAGSYS